MPEEIKNSTDAGDGNNDTGSGNNDANNGGGDDQGGEQPTEEKKDGDGGDGSDDDGKNEKPTGDDDEPVVRKRKTVKDYIIERKEKKIQKLQNELGKKDADDDSDESDEEEDDVDPKDEELITKVVSKKLAPIFEKQLQAEDEQELQDFIKDNPDFKPYEAKARKFMQHPSRRQLPISSIFYEVAGPDLMKIGAKRAKEADDEARRSQAGGGSARGQESEKVDWANMSDEEFRKKREEVRSKRSE